MSNSKKLRNQSENEKGEAQLEVNALREGLSTEIKNFEDPAVRMDLEKKLHKAANRNIKNPAKTLENLQQFAEILAKIHEAELRLKAQAEREIESSEMRIELAGASESQQAEMDEAVELYREHIAKAGVERKTEETNILTETSANAENDHEASTRPDKNWVDVPVVTEPVLLQPTLSPEELELRKKIRMHADMDPRDIQDPYLVMREMEGVEERIGKEHVRTEKAWKQTLENVSIKGTSGNYYSQDEVDKFLKADRADVELVPGSENEHRLTQAILELRLKRAKHNLSRTKDQKTRHAFRAEIQTLEQELRERAGSVTIKPEVVSEPVAPVQSVEDQGIEVEPEPEIIIEEESPEPFGPVQPIEDQAGAAPDSEPEEIEIINIEEDGPTPESTDPAPEDTEPAAEPEPTPKPDAKPESPKFSPEIARLVTNAETLLAKVALEAQRNLKILKNDDLEKIETQFDEYHYDLVMTQQILVEARKDLDIPTEQKEYLKNLINQAGAAIKKIEQKKIDIFEEKFARDLVTLKKDYPNAYKLLASPQTTLKGLAQNRRQAILNTIEGLANDQDVVALRKMAELEMVHTERTITPRTREATRLNKHVFVLEFDFEKGDPTLALQILEKWKVDLSSAPETPEQKVARLAELLEKANAKKSPEQKTHRTRPGREILKSGWNRLQKWLSKDKQVAPEIDTLTPEQQLKKQIEADPFYIEAKKVLPPEKIAFEYGIIDKNTGQPAPHHPRRFPTRELANLYWIGIRNSEQYALRIQGMNDETKALLERSENA